MDAFWPVMSLLPSTLVAVAFLSRNARKRWSLRRVRADLLDALASGADLTAVEHELAYLVDELQPDPPSARAPGVELRLLHAVAAMERLDFEVARVRLDSAREHPAEPWARTRLALLRAQPDSVAPDDAPPPLLGPLVDDTRALLALAAGRAEQALATHPHALPTTRARLLAALGRDDDALTVLDSLAPTRLDALCRAFPADPAVLLHARTRHATPYR